MNKLSFKKLLPGLVSVIIIAGMAAQSFATNVDMAAFVKKDKYMTKYYELDWRIDAIEKKLLNLYQLTCTNVKTFGGTYINSGSDSIDKAFPRIYTSSENNMMNIYKAHGAALFSHQKYLRFNTNPAFYRSGLNRDHRRREKQDIPASLCKWMDGIEPAENCMITVELDARYNATADYVGYIYHYKTITMGPFKKFKYPSAAGSSYPWCWINPYFGNLGVVGYTGVLTRNVASNPTDLQYAVNSLTKPTSWTNLSTVDSTPYCATQSVGATATSDRWPAPNFDELPDNAFYSNKNIANIPYIYWQSNIPSVSLEGKTNIWIKIQHVTTAASSTVGRVNYLSGTGAITNWNNNK